MSYQLYRNTTLGHTLQESLDELIQNLFLVSPLNGAAVASYLILVLIPATVLFLFKNRKPDFYTSECGQIPPQLALKILLQFDKVINTALASKIKARLTFKAGHLETYRFCDNVWTFVLKDVEFREVQELIRVDKVKIVACDGKDEKKA